MTSLKLALWLVLIVGLILAFGRTSSSSRACRTMSQSELDDLWQQRAEQRSEDARRQLND